MKKISLADYCGQYCTGRNNQGLAQMISILEKALCDNEEIVIDRIGVNIMTSSFIDELLPGLAIKHSKEKVEKLIRFEPHLEEYFSAQIDRGIRLRS